MSTGINFVDIAPYGKAGTYWDSRGHDPPHAAGWFADAESVADDCDAPDVVRLLARIEALEPTVRERGTRTQFHEARLILGELLHGALRITQWNWLASPTREASRNDDLIHVEVVDDIVIMWVDGRLARIRARRHALHAFREVGNRFNSRRHGQVKDFLFHGRRFTNADAYVLAHVVGAEEQSHPLDRRTRTFALPDGSLSTAIVVD